MAVGELNLDGVREKHMAEHPLAYRDLVLYGRTWRVKAEPNIVFTLVLSDGGGTKGLLNFLLGYVKSDEREAFREALEADEYFDADMLGELVSALTTEVTGRPLEPSSASPPSSSDAGTTSTADSSTVEVPGVSMTSV